MGFQTTGTASEYFAVDASKVTPIPEDMSDEEGAMMCIRDRSSTARMVQKYLSGYKKETIL